MRQFLRLVIHPFHIALFLILLITSVLPYHALAAEEHTFRAEADAKVVADEPDQNFGDSPSFAADGSPDIESYVRFRVSNAASIRRAVLRVWAKTGTGDLPTVALAENSWDERSITWNKRPERISTRRTYDGGTSAERWVEFDVSRFVPKDGTYTFILDNDSGDRLTMASRESSTPPQLRVEVGEGTTPNPPPPTPSAPNPPAPPNGGSGDTWYVFAGAPSGGNGESWDRAWNELDDIRWSRIRPGDIIRVGRGTYRETLEVDANGSEGKPIRILFEPGSTLFGGRSTALPDCGQDSYIYRAGSSNGIALGNASHIVIDGQQWDGLKISGWQHGIDMDDARHITIRNVDITDNGTAERDGSGWRPRYHGVNLGGVRSVLFDRINIHDNGADGIHAYNNIADVTVRDSWFHNDRGWRFNGCGHPDGLQINGGYSGKNITFQRVVSGPGVYHTILSNAGGENWRFEDVLAFDPITSPLACRGNCRGFTFNRITSDGKDGRLNFELSGGDHRITNSIVTNGNNKLPSGVDLDNNYQHDLDGDRVGSSRDPQYRNPENGDYTPQADVNGAGSRITSVDRLIANMQRSSTSTARAATAEQGDDAALQSDDFSRDGGIVGAENIGSPQDTSVPDKDTSDLPPGATPSHTKPRSSIQSCFAT